MNALKLLIPAFVSFVLLSATGCANIIPPGGGPKDSLPPVLLMVTPPDSSLHVKPARIVFTFDEYIEQVQNTGDIIISPTLPTPPDVSSRLRNLTVRMKDTLEANTTYSINFGKTIKDVNEGNILQDFTYVFSTGATIDENTFSGKVILAETGKTDTTLIAVLHRDLSDTAITRLRPRYYSRLDGSGGFTFRNLPAGAFAVYVVDKDSYLKVYNDSTQLFAFLDSPVQVSANTRPVTLYAYREAKPRSPGATGGSTPPAGRTQDRRLRYTYSEGNNKDVLSPLHLEFSRKIKTFDTTGFELTDTAYNRLPGYRLSLDSSYTRVRLQYPWRTGSFYKLLIRKDAVADSNGVALTKSDTLNFRTQGAEEYGLVRIRFNNLDLSKNPVLQIVQNEVVVDSVVLTGREWKRELFKPGDYDLRILFDTNKNGRWDAGNFRLKKQPEIVQALPRRLSIRGNWDNEIDINL